METVENRIRKVAVSVKGMENFVENKNRVYHKISHTFHRHPLNSLRFTTVPTAPAAAENASMLE